MRYLRTVITDLDSHDHDSRCTEQHDRWMGFDRDEVRRWLRETGLDNVSVGRIDEKCCTASDGEERTAIGIFVALGTKTEAA